MLNSKQLMQMLSEIDKYKKALDTHRPMTKSFLKN